MPKIVDGGNKIGRGFDVPSEKIISEGDRFIKTLSTKQLNTNITLERELNRELNFASPHHQLPLKSPGLQPLHKFQTEISELKEIEKFRTHNLNDYEIQIWREYKTNGLRYLHHKYKNLSNESIQKTIDRINSKLAKTPEITATSCDVRDDALRVKPDSVETKLLKFALESQKRPIVAPDDPINCLVKLEEKLRPVPSLKKRRKLCRKYLDKRNDAVEKPPIKKVYGAEPRPKIETTVTEEVQTKIEPKGAFVGCTRLIPLQDIRKQRLSLEDIQKKFPNYDTGDENKVLFVKNLPKNVKPDDLTSLFGHFEDGKTYIQFKIMEGKMKGQAFITFASVELAKKALEEINGFVLNERPIILQYGRSKT